MFDYRKILAVSLIASMVMGSSSVAFAEDKKAEASGSGSVEYVAEGDVFDVIFPVAAEGTFDYILDPQGLIVDTNNEKYAGMTFEANQTLYFLRASTSNAANNYMHNSDEMKVVNKSTQAVDVAVTAKVAAVDGIVMATDSNALASVDDQPLLYLAVSGQATGDASAEETAITTDGVAFTKSIAADENAYEVKWNPTKQQYEMALTAAASADGYAGFKSYTFQLTGACNTYSGWSALEGQAPQVDLVWSVDDFTESGPQMILSTEGLITITGLTSDKNYKALNITHDGGTTEVKANLTWDTSDYNNTTGGDLKIQMNSSWTTWLAGQNVTLKLTLTDDTEVTATAKFN